MKNNNQSWRVFFIISIILYFLSLVLIVLLIRNVPTQYIKLQKSENVEIRNKIKNAVSNNNLKEYEDIVKNNYVDFVVYNRTDNKVEYSSLNIKNNIDMANQNANDNVISNKDTLTITRDGVEYEVWIIQYFISPQKIFDIWVITLIGIIVALLTIVVIALSILFFKYIKPIHRLRDTVHKISSYQLDMINDVTNRRRNTEYDQINKDLQEFSIELEDNMKKTGYQYSILEKKLLTKNENIEYKNELLGSLAHDLKAPLSLSIIKLDNLIDDKNSYEIINIKDKLESVIQEINSINNIIYNDNEDIFLRKEDVDIVELIMNAVTEFEELLDSKQLIIDYSMDDKVIMNTNVLRLKQLIYNALSNIYDHAPVGADVRISCYRETNRIILSFYNDGNKLSEEDLNNMFSIFFKKENNNRNSGLGMYTMKTIVVEMNGEISARNYEDGILIEVIFNVKN